MRWLLLLREARNLPRHLRELRRLMRTYRFPLVHLNDSPLLPAAWVARRHRAKIVWHLRSALAGEGRDRRSHAIAAWIDRYGDAAIAIDRDVAARFPIRLPMTIVHNSVERVADGANGGAAKSALELPQSRVAIGFAGFIRRQKGWPELVDAAEILVREGAPVQFVIMGGGVRPPEYFRTFQGRLLKATNLLSDEETAIRQLVRQKGLDAHFSFLPFTTRTGEIYSGLDIVAFPNQGVGLGRPVLEAAMHGKPVVAAGSEQGGGVLIDGTTGLLLQDPSSRAIADALRALVDDVDLRTRLGAAGRALARDQFDPIRNARVVERIYEQLLGVVAGGDAPAAAEQAERPAAVA
jgi:glycosyltransferase involved in cell wall biosynthesis